MTLASHSFRPLPRFNPSGQQRTLRNPIGCVGTGLHTGAKVALTLHPAEPGTGIRFLRYDRAGAAPVPARFDAVSDTMMSTTLADRTGGKVATVEHIMAALAACEVDNALIEVGGPEVPIMDGSAQPFVFLIECAGRIEQDRPRRFIEILKPVTVTRGDKIARLEPAVDVGEPGGEGGLEIDFTIRFDHPLIRSQSLRFAFTPDRFKAEIAKARTFGFAEQVEDLWARGLALGGSLKNAVVVSRDRVLNEEGLRFEDEFVRHKVLDCVGDLYLAGAPLIGRYTGYCAGHAMNNELLRALFADPSAWQYVGGGESLPELAPWEREELPRRRRAVPA
ncbi:MAG TPA: UDP-3-O-acyl-N-acetylglucosamine deacetylase [Geminicoccaceae bacterium]|nr:UDP-3-O-acyl-N-acetylglucosamine deacetylase [Geminicoccaceae bacterium]